MVSTRCSPPRPWFGATLAAVALAVVLIGVSCGSESTDFSRIEETTTALNRSSPGDSSSSRFPIGTDCESTRAGSVPPTTGASLTYCDLHGMDLSGLTLRAARLDGANLSDAVLDRADLSEAVLGVANLPGASFVGADLTDASLSYSNVWNADFTDANLSGARLTDASLTGVVWSNTTCPDGSNSDSHANTCVGYGV